MAARPLINPQVSAAIIPTLDCHCNFEKEVAATTTQQLVTAMNVAVKGLRREAEILANTPHTPDKNKLMKIRNRQSLSIVRKPHSPQSTRRTQRKIMFDVRYSSILLT
jgi:hypothetical protein